jgi:hypothetical protein
LKPAELARLMNSTPLGEVTTTARVYRQRDQGGLRIGDGATIDLIRYTAWMFHGWVDRRADARASLSQEDRHRLDEAARSRMRSASTRNIGPIPVISDFARRESCRRDLAKFIMTYAGDGKAPFSDDHFRVIKRIENAVFHGGRFVEAVFRGFGKTTISRAAAAWVLLYGHRRFVPIIGGTAAAAEGNLDAIQSLFESSPLADDFPEVCHPVLMLDGINQRAKGQLYETAGGVTAPTRVSWGKKLARLPMTDGAVDRDGVFHPNVAAGAVILSCGITSSEIRGLNKRRRDGMELRPDFVILDDPQSDESAASSPQTDKRLDIIRKAILRSAGHAKGISVVMPCTVIRRGDLVDRLLDATKNPTWQGERIPFVRKWADRHDTLWLEDYASLRKSCNPADPDDYLRARREATAFYLKNREAMDAGCVVSWDYCFASEEDEVSAIQHAYNALIDDGEEVFASEFQNQPLVAAEDEGQLTREEVAAKMNRAKRGHIPVDAQTLTAFVDVQGKALYWMVCAWASNFTGYIVDYGVLPEQDRRHFTLRQVERTLLKSYPNTGQEGAWRAGFDALAGKLLSREWKRDDGAAMRIARCLIDAGDGNAQAVVQDFCRQSAHAAVLLPSKGQGVTAGRMPFSEYRRKRGDRVSDHNWRIPAAAGRSARTLLFDANYWKSFIRSRWRVALGDPGSLTLFGERADAHRMLLDHMVSEYSTRTEGRGRRLDEWDKRPNVSDNHFWDCLVGCAVAASEQGIVLPETGTGGRRVRKPPIDLSALQRGGAQ